MKQNSIQILSSNSFKCDSYAWNIFSEVPIIIMQIWLLKSTNDYFLFQQLWNFIEEDDDEGDKYYNCTAELFLYIDVTVFMVSWFWFNPLVANVLPVLLLHLAVVSTDRHKKNYGTFKDHCWFALRGLHRRFVQRYFLFSFLFNSFL